MLTMFHLCLMNNIRKSRISCGSQSH